MTFRLNKKTLEVLFLTVMFFFAISLFNYAGYIFSAVVACMLLFYIKNIYISYIEVILLFFSASYCFFYMHYFGFGLENLIIYFIGPWTSYMLGKLYITKSLYKNAFFIFISVLAAGMFLHGVLNIFAYINSEYFNFYQYYRQSVDFWRGELVNVKTTEMLYTFATGISLGVIFSNVARKYKIIAAIVMAFSLGVTVFLANRTLIIIFFVIFLWRGLFWLFSKKVPGRSKMVVVVSILLIVVILSILIVLNIGGLGTAFASLKIVQRLFGGGELSRFDVWDNFFRDFNFIKYPMGGSHMTEGTEFSYLHNMWLDVYDMVGVIPFLFLIALTGIMVFQFLRFRHVMKLGGRDDEYTIFHSLMFAVVLNFMVEPIIKANPYYFLIVLMYMGAMESRTRQVLAETAFADTQVVLDEE